MNYTPLTSKQKLSTMKNLCGVNHTTGHFYKKLFTEGIRAVYAIGEAHEKHRFQTFELGLKSQFFRSFSKMSSSVGVNIFLFLFLFLQCQQNKPSHNSREHSVDLLKMQDSYDLIDSIFTHGDRLRVTVFKDKIIINTIRGKSETQEVVDNLPFQYSLTKWKGIFLKQESQDVNKNDFVFLNNSLAILSVEDDLNRGIFLPIFKEQNIWYPLKENQSTFFFAIKHWPLFVDLNNKSLIVISPSFDDDTHKEDVFNYTITVDNVFKLAKISKLPEKFQYSRPEYYPEIFNIE